MQLVCLFSKKDVAFFSHLVIPTLKSLICRLPLRHVEIKKICHSHPSLQRNDYFVGSKEVCLFFHIIPLYINTLAIGLSSDGQLV